MAKTRRPVESDPGLADPRNANAGKSDRNAGEEHDAIAAAHSPDRIAERAYELYLARGGSDGQDFDDWLAAERELASGRSPQDDSSEER